jgi:hypothetical protein
VHAVKKRSPSAAVWGMGFSGAFAPSRKKHNKTIHFQPKRDKTNKRTNIKTNK